MRPTVTSVINGKKMLVRVGIENIEPKGVGSRMGANHPAPFNAARRLAEGAGHSVELSAVTEVLYMKTYGPTQTALFGIGLGGDLIGLKARGIPRNRSLFDHGTLLKIIQNSPMAGSRAVCVHRVT